MAKIYLVINPDLTKQQALGKAQEAYDIFRDAEFEVQIKEQEWSR